MRGSERKFDHFLAAGDLAKSIREHFAVFFGDDGGEFGLAGVEQFAKLEQNLLTVGPRHVAPGGKGVGGCRDCSFDVGSVGEYNLLGHHSPGRVVNVEKAVARTGGLLAIDVVQNLLHMASLLLGADAAR